MSFRWTDGWPTYYSRWAKDEPGNDPDACVAMNSEGEWYDAHCNVHMAAMCKQTDGMYHDKCYCSLIGC